MLKSVHAEFIGEGEWRNYWFSPVRIIPPLPRIYNHIKVSLNRRTQGPRLERLQRKLCSSGNGDRQERRVLCTYLESLHLENYLRDFCYE